MEAINSSFYFVTDKIVELQSFFHNFAKYVAYIALLLSVCVAAFNYAVMGTGLKENVVKIMKAVIFYAVVMLAYPNIVSWMTNMSFTLARDSTYNSMQNFLMSTAKGMEIHADEQRRDNIRGTYGTMALGEYDLFNKIIEHRTFTTEGQDGSRRELSYSTVAPFAALGSVMLVAGECFNYASKQSGGFFEFPDFGAILKGVIIGAVVIAVGCFTVLNYLLAFIEFMFISSVGIILFPLSLFEGTKFMAEKFITAMIGFFIKLLFCTICIFFMLYGYISLASTYVKEPFMGQVEDVIIIVFSSLLFFFISVSAPGLAQSLLTGSPSLSAGGAVRMVASGVAAAASVPGLIRKVSGSSVVQGGVKAATGLAGALIHGAGAASAASAGASVDHSSAGRAALGARAFFQDMGHQAASAVGNNVSNITRSLGSRPGQFYNDKFHDGEKVGREIAANDMKKRIGL